MNLIAEDLVRLLLREQQINKDKQNLQERLDKSMSQADIAALGLAVSIFCLKIELFKNPFFDFFCLIILFFLLFLFYPVISDGFEDNNVVFCDRNRRLFYNHHFFLKKTK